MNLINKKNLFVSLAFGAAGFLVTFFKFYFIIPGTAITTDLRDLIVIVGSALTGPVGGIIIGFLSSVIDPAIEVKIYVILLNVAAGLLVGLSYKKLVFEKSVMPFLILRWIVLIFCYYFILFVFFFAGIYWIDKESFKVFLQEEGFLFNSLAYGYNSLYYDFLFASFFTSLILIALPQRYRKPFWGKEVKTKIGSKHRLLEKNFFKSPVFKNILPLRLITWFLLFAVIPILLLGVSIKENVIDSELKHEASFRFSLAGSFKQKFFEMPRKELIKNLKETIKNVDGEIFILNNQGIYALVVDSVKEGKNAAIDYSSQIIQKIIQKQNGHIIDIQNNICFGFATYHGKMHDLTIVSASNPQTIRDITSRLENNVFNKLVIGIIIVSLALIIVIWILIKIPLAKFKMVISQFSKGNYDIRVPADEMNDEIKTLADSFNEMADNIIDTNRSLEEEIIQHKKVANKLKESEERWKFALEGAGDGVWDWNLETNKIFFSTSWKKMLGYDDHEITDSFDEWSIRLHPDDKEKSLSDMQKYFDGETPYFTLEHRMLCKNGSYKWILGRGKIVERKPDGKPLRVIGTHTDIDNQKKNLEELEKKNKFIQEILDNLPIGLATNKIDSGEADYINKKFTEIYGWTPKIITNISNFFESVYPEPEYRREVQSMIMKDIESGDPAKMRWDNIKITTETGEERFVSAANIPIPSQNIMVSTVQDVTDKKRANDLLIERNKSLSAIVEISSILTSSLDLKTTLQSITESITNHLGFDGGVIHLVEDDYLLLKAQTPQSASQSTENTGKVLISEHSFISKAIKEQRPVFLNDSSKVELLPMERKIIENKRLKSLLYIPIISQNDVVAILIVSTVNRLKHLSEIEIDVCRTLSNIAALSITNSKLFQASLDDIVKLEEEIEERIKVEKALKASEDKFSKAFKINPDAIVINRLSDGIFLDVNEGFTKITGYTYEELVGKSFTEINIWNDQSVKKQLFVQLVKIGEIKNYEGKFFMKDGTVKTGLMSANIIDIGGEKYILSIIMDITEQKKSEEELKENQHRLAETNQLLKYVLDTVPSRIFWKDRNSLLLGCNQQFAKDAGKENPEELIGLSDYEMGWKDQAELYRADDKSVMDSGVPKLNYEEPQTTPSGELIWLKTSKVPLRDVKGNLMGVLGTYEDITEQKLAEQALKESEERYKSLFNNNHSVMLLINPDSGQIVDANPAACKYYGWNHSEMINKNISEINTLTGKEIFNEIEAAKKNERNHFFFKHRLANNDIRDVEVFSGTVVINSESFLYSIIHDITEQKRAEKALLESEEKYRYMFAGNPQPMWIYDLETLNFLEVNDAAVHHYGYSKEEFLKMSLRDIRAAEDIPSLLEEIKKIDEGYNPFGEARHIKKDGSVIYVDLAAHSVLFNGKPARHILIRDITEQKRLIMQISDSLKEKEVLLKEIHHRVKNNFQVIISLLSLQSELVNDPLILSYFMESRNRIKSMALIHELLYRETNLDYINIRHYIESLVDYLKRSYSENNSNVNVLLDVDEINIEIDTIIPCGLIINELISNSMKHAFPDGKNGEVFISFKKDSNGFFNLIVKDNGVGIPKDMDIANLKSLGMLLVNTLTKQLSGDLNIKTSQSGSEFEIKFTAVTV